MIHVIAIAGATLLLLEVLKALFGARLAVLPLGGDHFKQTGIVLGLAFVALQILVLWP
jgi:hypothetical protein